MGGVALNLGSAAGAAAMTGARLIVPWLGVGYGVAKLTEGVLDKAGNLLTGLTPRDIDDLVADGTLSGGMLPKIGSALDAARNGVKSVHIIDGRVEHCLLLEILTDHGVGTMIKSK